MRKTKIGLASSLILLSMFACNVIAPTPAPSPTPIARVDELQFKDPETGRRFRALDRCINEIIDDSWRTTPYQLSGNFYTSRWCSGVGARNNCVLVNTDDRDQHGIGLNTLFRQNFPEVFGLGLQSLWMPKSTGWGTSFYFSENGDSVVGDGWGVMFREYNTPAGPPAAVVQLGWVYGYTLPGPNQAMIEYSSDLPLREDLALYLSSPQAMRDRGLGQSQALAHKVVTAINTHQVNTCDEGPYLGKGLPPACTPRPLTSSEEAAELARAKEYFSEQEQLLTNYYQEMYAAWMMAFPLDACWQ